MCVFEDFRGRSGLGRNSDRQPQECITKAPKLNGGGGGSKWHEALAFGPRATTYPVTGDKSLHILKSVSSVKGSQLGLSPQGYYKDCVSQSTGKGLTAIKFSEPLKARGLTSAIL